MPHAHDKNRYAQSVGHIAIEWNYLEHDLQQIGYSYLTVDADVAAHIFAFMGNVTRAEFIAYLVGRFEERKEVKSHLKHFLDIYNRLRGNRNVVEHGIPALTPSGVYLDEIIKIDRRGDELPFAASQATLDEFLKNLHTARDYAHTIKKMIDVLSDDAAIDAATYERPEMPPRMKSQAYRKAQK